MNTVGVLPQAVRRCCLAKHPSLLSISRQYYQRRANKDANILNAHLSRKSFGNPCVRYASRGRNEEATNRHIKRGLLSATATSIVMFGFYHAIRLYKESTADEDQPSAGDTSERVYGEINIGGDWKLTDTNGQPISSDDYKGKWYFLYFGFCHCPDICPDELEKVSAVMDELAARSDVPNLKTVFITVDPWRDTVEVMKKYCEEFHTDLIGVTGAVDEVKEAAMKFRIYVSKGPIDDDGDYIVDHSILTYLMNPKGKPEHFYNNTKLKDYMVKDVVERIHRYEKKHKQRSAAA